MKQPEPGDRVHRKNWSQAWIGTVVAVDGPHIKVRWDGDEVESGHNRIDLERYFD